MEEKKRRPRLKVDNGSPLEERRESEKYPRQSDRNSGSFERKPWQDRQQQGSGERKPWQDRNQQGGERKPWQDRQQGGGERKPWQDRNQQGGGERRPWPRFTPRKPRVTFTSKSSACQVTKPLASRRGV